MYQPPRSTAGYYGLLYTSLHSQITYLNSDTPSILLRGILTIPTISVYLFLTEPNH